MFPSSEFHFNILCSSLRWVLFQFSALLSDFNNSVFFMDLDPIQASIKQWYKTQRPLYL